MRVVARGFFCALMLLGTPALASETIVYSYDALGRILTVTHSGSVNNGLVASYTHDKADNRTNLTVTGSANGSMPAGMTMATSGSASPVLGGKSTASSVTTSDADATADEGDPGDVPFSDPPVTPSP